MRIVARSGTWLVVLLVTLRQLHDLDLAATPTGTLEGPDAAAALVMALARLATLGIGWYLVAATVVTLSAGLAGVAGAAGPLTGRLVPHTVHQGLRRVCGLTLALTATVPSLAAADERAPITMHLLAEEPAAGDAPAITMRRLDPPLASTPPSSAPAPSSHVVTRGEHLWAVAESTLAAAWSTPPADGQIDPYWRELIRRNRSRLPDPANPDLVHPGLELDLPPVPARDV